MMDHEQLELNFDTEPAQEQKTGVVVPLSAYADARRQRQLQVERSDLLKEIVRSVDHIRGSDPEAEAM
jgi:hypothetical protein